MKKELQKRILFMIFVSFIPAGILFSEGKASSLASEQDSTVVPTLMNVSWEQLIPFQPPEKWLSPKGEDDEWYQRRQQQKYKKRR